MRKADAYEIAFRVLGIYLFFQCFNNFNGLMVYTLIEQAGRIFDGGDVAGMGTAVAYGFVRLIILGVAVGLTVAARPLSRWVCKNEFPEDEITPRPPQDWVVIAFSTLGLFLAIQALVVLFSDLGILIEWPEDRSASEAAQIYAWQARMMSVQAICHAIQLASGITLFLGGARFARFWRRTVAGGSTSVQPE